MNILLEEGLVVSQPKASGEFFGKVDHFLSLSKKLTQRKLVNLF